MPRTLLKALWPCVAYAVLDTLAVGVGMGVPILAIALGFPLGWYLARRLTAAGLPLETVLSRTLLYAAGASAYTLLVMAVIWGPMAQMLFDPAADLANFGIPMILYEPRASFVGWLVLMILISPFLQLLTALFGAQVTLLWRLRRREWAIPLAQNHEANG